MRIDKDLLGAYEAGRAGAAAGANYRDNPHYYTSSMSDAWETGRALAATGRIAEVGEVLGFSTRGLVYRHAQTGARYRWRVSYVYATQGHDVWRASA